MRLPDGITAACIAAAGGIATKLADFFVTRRERASKADEAETVAEITADVVRERLLWDRICNLEQRLDERETAYQARIDHLEHRIAELEAENVRLRQQVARLDPGGTHLV